MWIFTLKFYKNILYKLFSFFFLFLAYILIKWSVPSSLVYFSSLWVWLTFCKKNIPLILKARCNASSFLHSRDTTSARLHKRHQITGVCVWVFFFLKCLLFFSPIIHITKQCVTCDREKEIVPADDIYKRKVTSLLLMLEYLSAFFLCFCFFFTQCQNISQHHHYVIEKECKKYGPAHFK